MPDTVDVIVIGAGPAGLAAATAVAEAGRACLCVDMMGPGGQLMNLGLLHDCPDLPEGTTGPDLLGLMVERAVAAGVEMGFGEVGRISPADAGAWRVDAGDESWLARAVVVATGLGPGTTGLVAEARFEGRGLSHCANCDGPLYRDQPVVVAGGSSRWALAEAIALAGIASEVTLVLGEDDLASLSRREPERLAYAGAEVKVAVLCGAITGLVGEEALSAVDVRLVAGPTETISARALFLLGGRVPATACLAGVVPVAPGAAVPLLPGDGTAGSGTAGALGLFAAGDVVAGAAESIPEAIATGERAGQNAVRWLASRPAAA